MATSVAVALIHSQKDYANSLLCTPSAEHLLLLLCPRRSDNQLFKCRVKCYFNSLVNVWSSATATKRRPRLWFKRCLSAWALLRVINVGLHIRHGEHGGLVARLWWS